MAKAVNRYWEKAEASWGTWVQTFSAKSLYTMEKVSSYFLDLFTGFWFHFCYKSSGWRWQLHESLGQHIHLQGNDGVSSWAGSERKYFWELLHIWSSTSNEESATTLINKGYISLRKGGDNVLARSSKCFSFQPNTLQSCLGSAWADCASSLHTLHTSL